MILEYVKGPLVVPFFILQFGIGSVLPLLLITFTLWRGISGNRLVMIVTGCAVLVLLAVLMMRSRHSRPGGTIGGSDGAHNPDDFAGHCGSRASAVARGGASSQSFGIRLIARLI
jgi:hypothetical protein